MSLLTQRCVNCGNDRLFRDFTYREGELSSVCKLCSGTSTSRIQGKMVTKKGNLLSEEILIKLYHEQGLSLEDVGKQFGVTRQMIHKYLKKFGITGRGKSKARILALQRGKLEGKSTAVLNETLFSHWSQPMAYLLGYIFTDGSLIYEAKSNSHRVQISSIDRDHLEKLATILGKNVPIYYMKQAESTPTKSQDRYMIQFTRPKMIEDVRKLGLTERKTLSMKFPRVPEEFFRDFIRGCWDGDGSIFTSRDHRLGASFVTGSLAFIQRMCHRLRDRGFGQLNIHVRNPDQIKGNVEAKHPRYDTRIHGKNAAKFCEFLYDNVSTDIILQRKALVYESWRRIWRTRRTATCDTCSKSIDDSKRGDSRYCSRSCRHRAYRQRRGAALGILAGGGKDLA